MNNLESRAEQSRAEQSRAFNLLKIVAIFFVIEMHFLSHSGYLSIDPDIKDLSWNLTWLVRSFIMVAVNCFVMITGFYSIEKNVDTKKCLRLMDTALFYSVFIGVVCISFGVKVSFVNIINIVLPFSTKSYWFVTCYIVLYLLIPMINRVIKSLDKKQFTKYLLIMIALFSIIPTLFNSFCSTLDDSNGFSVIWFIILYSVGAWLRLNYNTIRRFTKKAWCAYVGFSLITYVVSVGVTAVGLYISSGFVNYPLNYIGYNYLSVFLASVSLFIAFSGLKIDEKWGRLIGTISSTTLGIYLISEQCLLRNVLFTEITKCDAFIGNPIWVLVMITASGCIFICCSCIELLREKFIGTRLCLMQRVYELVENHIEKY